MTAIGKTPARGTSRRLPRETTRDRTVANQAHELVTQHRRPTLSERGPLVNSTGSASERRDLLGRQLGLGERIEVRGEP
jgi:hypothetical protein